MVMGGLVLILRVVVQAALLAPDPTFTVGHVGFPHSNGLPHSKGLESQMCCMNTLNQLVKAHHFSNHIRSDQGTYPPGQKTKTSCVEQRHQLYSGTFGQ